MEADGYWVGKGDDLFAGWVDGGAAELDGCGGVGLGAAAVAANGWVAEREATDAADREGPSFDATSADLSRNFLY